MLSEGFCYGSARFCRDLVFAGVNLTGIDVFGLVERRERPRARNACVFCYCGLFAKRLRRKGECVSFDPVLKTGGGIL